MKKRLLCGLLAFLLMGSLCACELPEGLELFDFGGNQPHMVPNPSENPSGAQEQDTPEPTEVTVTLSDYAITINPGNAWQLEAWAQPNSPLKWRSSNESVALVNSQGLITAVGAGVANITCYTNDGGEAVCTVTVRGGYSQGDYIFPHSSSSYLTESEVRRKLASMTGYSPSGSYALDAINEIYARNGYIFMDSNLQAYYEAMSWYVPNRNFSAGAFNNYENQNIALLMGCM